MPTDTPVLSAILCTYNRAELLPRVLESIASQTLDKDVFEVIVVDDGSTDESREIVQSFREIPALRYSFQRNSGLAGAKNHGIFLSRAPIVVFLDDDDVLAPQLLEIHLETHRRYPAMQDAVLGFTDLAPDLASDTLMHYVTQVGYQLSYYPGIRDGDFLDYTFFWGGRSSCKREFLIERGIFDPTFRFGCEDIELGYRLSRFGLQVIYNERARSSMIRRIDFDGFCRRSYLQGQSQYIFSQLHPVPEIIHWTEMDAADTEWEKMQPVTDYVFGYARSLDRIVRKRMVEQRQIDKATIDLLHEAYRTAFHLAKLQGINQLRLGSDEEIPKMPSCILEQPINESEITLSLSRTVAEQDAALAERNITLTAERDAALVERNSAMAERDAALVERNSAMAERDAALAARDQAITELSRINPALNSLRQHALQLEEQLLILQKSYSMRLTAPLRASADFVRRLRARIRSKPEQYIPTEPAEGEYHPPIVAGVSDQVDELEYLIFEEPSKPVVSIIIPVFNKWRYTYACLQSIRNYTTGKTSYEVILADDESIDDTPKMLQYVHGIHVIRNSENLGFLRNCNNAARLARGKFLCFLNNDTEVNESWLDALVSVFESFDKVGLVGGKLIYQDGRIQEAGGIIKRDGWGVPYGRYDEPSVYQYNYVKEVDCIIGACFMVRKDLFDMLEGFDDRYYPAFYEEFDLEFGIRNLGYKVMYQPRAVIMHHESSSYGEEIKHRQSSLNHAKFCEKWQNQLKSQPMERDFFLARDRSQGKKIILIVDDKVPEYDKHAGALAIFQNIRLFLDLGFKVIYLPDDRHPSQPYTGELHQLGIEVIYGEFNFARWIQSFGGYLHYAWLARPDVAIKYIDLIKNHSNARILYYTHDLHYLRLERQFALEGTQLLKDEAERCKKVELEIFESVDVILTPSVEEEKIIREHTSSKEVYTLPLHFYDFSEESKLRATPFSERYGVVFLGHFLHAPNTDAVKWFVQDILPRVRSSKHDLTVDIVGSDPPDDVWALESNNVHVLGYVKDLAPVFDRIRVFVAPLRYGAGVKGKIINSLLHGLPVVTTAIGNEGLGLIHGREALIADDAESFARCVIELHSDWALWEQIVAGGYEFLRRNFSYARAKQIILAALGITVVADDPTGRV